MAEAEVLIKEKGAPEDVEASLSMSLSSQTLAPFRNATSELYRLQLVHWRNEAGSPELLAYWDGADSVRELLEALEGRVVSDEDLGCSLPFGAEALFKCERERLKFMLSEYLRIRLAKVESYTAWLLETPERRELLSSPELQFAQRFHELQRQLYSSIDETIAGLPRELIEHDRTLSVRHPNTQSHVFAQFCKTVHNVTLDPSLDPVTIEAGELYIVPYESVKQYVQDGHAVVV
ncbi:DNA replication complex GINS protein sld5 [Diplonema papillatum]|nr:DNA replication complex GINS protein sld5 [Diplonema papillatum]